MLETPNAPCQLVRGLPLRLVEISTFMAPFRTSLIVKPPYHHGSRYHDECPERWVYKPMTSFSQGEDQNGQANRRGP